MSSSSSLVVRHLPSYDSLAKESLEVLAQDQPSSILLRAMPDELEAKIGGLTALRAGVAVARARHAVLAVVADAIAAEHNQVVPVGALGRGQVVLDMQERVDVDHLHGLGRRVIGGPERTGSAVPVCVGGKLSCRRLTLMTEVLVAYQRKLPHTVMTWRESW